MYLIIAPGAAPAADYAALLPADVVPMPLTSRRDYAHILIAQVADERWRECYALDRKLYDAGILAVSTTHWETMRAVVRDWTNC